MKPYFGRDGLKLLMTDTDSLYYLITSLEDPVDKMRRLNESGECPVFDLSRVERYKDCINKNKMGTFKFEAGDEVITEAVFLAPKMYAYEQRLPDGQLKQCVKGKGIPTKQLKRLRKLEAYKDCLFKNDRENVSFFAFRASKHIVKHCEVVRQGLTADNDKVFILGPEGSRPLGYYLNNQEPVGAPRPGWDLDASLITPEQRLILNQAALIKGGGLAGPPEDPDAILLEEDEFDVAEDDAFTEGGAETNVATEWGGETVAGDADDAEQFDDVY
jgi:hypothetical protein